MKCPTCRSIVAEDAAVCPKCDTVLDPSLFDATPPELDAEDTTGSHRPLVPPRAKAPGARSGTKRAGAPRTTERRRPVEPRRTAGRMPEAPPAAPRGSVRRDWREEVSQEDWDAMPRRPAPAFVADKALDPDDVIGQAKTFIVGLSTADKLAFFGSATMVLACFFPWKETVAEGEVLGLLSLGVVVFGLSVAALSAIVVRVRPRPRATNPLPSWVAQLGAIGFSELWCVMYAVTSLDTTTARSPVGNFEMWVSKPSFGLILAFLAGIVALAGTVMGLKETR